jgi:hypothetical protein
MVHLAAAVPAGPRTVDAGRHPAKGNSVRDPGPFAG